MIYENYEKYNSVPYHRIRARGLREPGPGGAGGVSDAGSHGLLQVRRVLRMEAEPASPARLRLRSDGRGAQESGETASGTKAKPGTIAADTSVFPFGTRMRIPGYGDGVVEDRGGAIEGGKIDLFFKSHKEALEWGRQTVTVEVRYP